MTNWVCIAKGERPKEEREKTGKREQKDGGFAYELLFFSLIKLHCKC